MEPIHGTCKASKYVLEDLVSTMPDNVITNIMDRLPIQDAVRTSIFSRNWRYKWTLITQLVCDANFYVSLPDIEKFGRIVSWLLLNLKGPITKCSLYIEDECYFEDINYWVMYLSGQGIKDFTLINVTETPYMLHSHFFSCQELTHLELYNCVFQQMHDSIGFPNLLSLNLCMVTFESSKCGEFLTRSPLLEFLKVFFTCLTGVIKQDQIAKLENLKVLSLPLCKLDNAAMMTSSSIFQLLTFFPRLQELELYFLNCKVW